MSLEDDRKRQQINADATRLDFQDLEMLKLIKNPGFTIERFRKEAARLIKLAKQVETEYNHAVVEGEIAAEPIELSEADALIIKDGANAQLTLDSIDRIGA